MGLFDKAKRMLGFGGAADEDDAAPEAKAAEREPSRKEQAMARARAAGRPAPAGRPPLVDAPPPSQTVDDALALRDAGDRAGARKLLAEIDRGSGLRTVLRAAAALEDGDLDELGPLLPAVAAEAEGHRLLLQLAAASTDAPLAAELVDRAAAHGAPDWALAWTRAVSNDEATRRAGLVELLWADAALARTVAARDLDIGGAVADASAAQRYAAFAHGRDCIRRFGAASVAELCARAAGGAS